MEEARIRQERAQNLWNRRVRKLPLLAKSAELDAVDRTIGSETALVAGSTMRPETLRPAFFVAPGRLGRSVEVNPVYPDDVVAALQIHAREAEKRTGRRRFEDVDWPERLPKGGSGIYL